tara:strand:+ start:6002 stop:6460 length:459 start_codon:yes stop_codon:yes gene_type:complete
MAEQEYKDVVKKYDIWELNHSYFPNKDVERGFWFWRHIESVPDRGNYTHARVCLTNHVLDSVGKALERDVKLAGISREDLLKVLEKFEGKFDEGKVELSMVNGKDNLIGLIDYSALSYPGYNPPGVSIEVTVLGKAIGNPRQFNNLQQGLIL